jgi:hypothetical protein
MRSEEFHRMVDDLTAALETQEGPAP